MAKHQSKQAAQAEKVPRWVRWVGVLGIGSKGLLHIVIGILAMMAASGDRDGATADTTGALKEIWERPFGGVGIVALAFGCAAYACWRFIQAFWDIEDLGRGAKGIARRVGYGFSGIMYAGLAIMVARLLAGQAKEETGDESAQDITGAIMGLPLGRALILGFGLAVVAVGVMQGARAVKAKVREDFERSEMGKAFVPWATAVGRVGLAADGVVFAVAGALFVLAAVQHDASEARGLGGALHWLLEQSFGHYLLMIMGVGVMAFGVYCGIRARYQLLRAPA